MVVWHFKGDKLLGETVFFDMGSIQRQIGARVTTLATSHVSQEVEPDKVAAVILDAVAQAR